MVLQVLQNVQPSLGATNRRATRGEESCNALFSSFQGKEPNRPCTGQSMGAMSPIHPGTLQGINQEAPRGSRWRTETKRVRPNLGSTDLGPPPFGPCFLWVTDMWSLMTVPGACRVLRWFGSLVGPWILVLHTWRCLIRRELLHMD